MKEAIEIAADLCRHFEGFSSKPYICPAGYWTIGYGSTYTKEGKPVTKDTPAISREEADELLELDLVGFLKQTLALCPTLAAHNARRMAAILDFVYNLGPARLRGSTLRKRIQSERWEDVPSELRKWVFGGGKKLPGLVKRKRSRGCFNLKELNYMATREFNMKQKEIVARKLGYDGPMQMFDEFVKSDPAMSRKYNTVLEKYMAKGGVVRRYQEGGDVTTTSTQTPITPMSERVDQTEPTAPTAPTTTAAQTTVTQDQLLSTQLAPTQATTITAIQAPAAVTAEAPTTTPAATMEAATAAPSVSQAVSTLQPAQGTVSQQAQVQAAQMEPTSTAISSLQAAEGIATQVTGSPIREAQTQELVSGPAVSMEKVEETLSQAEAAQGVVTQDMTVQGQLSTMMADFSAKNPPAWAAASLRGVTAVLAQRGLGASSLAGQAMLQATLEAAVPIASADAATYQQMALQNLSNRQQVAMLTAQQRAQFLGQEFDQAFQTRVLNAAKISDIANQNFTAQQQVALENARLAQTMDLANLNNRQALVMAEAAQIATLETQNLNNRQQAAVANAQAFLQMDMANLSNAQQTELFKAQSNVQAILSDQAAVNAARQFNASSQNQVNQFFAGLSAQVKQFNAQQVNAMAQFNTDQYNTVQRFNAESQNARDQFNAQNRLVIDQSNAQWRREVSTANTAATNRANEVNAQIALQVGLAEYNNQMQVFRDNIQYAFTAGENNRNRENYLAIANIQKTAAVEAAKLALEGKMYEALGNVSAKIMEKTTIAGDAYSAIKAVGGSIKGAAINLLGTGTGGASLIDTSNLQPGEEGYGWSYYTDGTAIDPDGNYYYQGNLVWSAGGSSDVYTESDFEPEEGWVFNFTDDSWEYDW